MHIQSTLCKASFHFTIFIFFCFPFEAFAQYKSTWKLFEHAEYIDTYIEEYDSYAFLLNCDESMVALENKEITITGYYIPVEESVFIISRFPNATCFFCGAAGMESVMQIRAKTELTFRPKTDDLLTFRGKLKVNCTDWQLVSFILEDADFIELE